MAFEFLDDRVFVDGPVEDLVLLLRCHQYGIIVMRMAKPHYLAGLEEEGFDFAALEESSPSGYRFVDVEGSFVASIQ